mmetsp:Transcript_2580/g.8629  ORF Transcript_2580/g.8629 Transcript_2580/m.8629 type:complete len:356 (-) Transcript_2580:374-1441(-)
MPAQLLVHDEGRDCLGQRELPLHRRDEIAPFQKAGPVDVELVEGEALLLLFRGVSEHPQVRDELIARDGAIAVGVELDKKNRRQQRPRVDQLVRARDAHPLYRRHASRRLHHAVGGRGRLDDHPQRARAGAWQGGERSIGAAQRAARLDKAPQVQRAVQRMRLERPLHIGAPLWVHLNWLHCRGTGGGARWLPGCPTSVAGLAAALRNSIRVVRSPLDRGSQACAAPCRDSHSLAAVPATTVAGASGTRAAAAGAPRGQTLPIELDAAPLERVHLIRGELVHDGPQQLVVRVRAQLHLDAEAELASADGEAHRISWRGCLPTPSGQAGPRNAVFTCIIFRGESPNRAHAREEPCV